MNIRRAATIVTATAALVMPVSMLATPAFADPTSGLITTGPCPDGDPGVVVVVDGEGFFACVNPIQPPNTGCPTGEVGVSVVVDGVPVTACFIPG